MIKIMTVKPSFQGFLGGMLFLLIPTSIFGQVDTVFSVEGEILEIGERINDQKQGKWSTYYDSGTLESEGYYEKGKKTGKWTWYHDNGLICSKEKYKYDYFKKGKFWDREGNPSDISEVEIEPEYPGGMDAFREMVAENLQYPQVPQEKGVDGRVFIRFNINEVGELVDSKIVKGVDPALDREALRVVRLSDTWKPGTFHGKKVKVAYTFPVVFILQ